MTYRPQKGRGYGHVTVIKFAVCRDAARRAGSSATAELVFSVIHIRLRIRASGSLARCRRRC